MLAVAQPVVHQLKDIHLRILAPLKLDVIGNVAEALLVPGWITSMHPQYPRLRRLLVRTIGVLDSKLRLASLLSAFGAAEAVLYLPNTAQTNKDSLRT